ncbi:MAG: hypothetical protein NZ585_15210, partial [Chloracidobacterium sp.]|nr:hypothetical protein [Chloracidobacterium sp.]
MRAWKEAVAWFLLGNSISVWRLVGCVLKTDDRKLNTPAVAGGVGRLAQGRVSNFDAAGVGDSGGFGCLKCKHAPAGQVARWWSPMMLRFGAELVFARCSSR